MTLWEAQIQTIPPAADWLRRMGEVTKREILTTWWTHLNQAFRGVPRARVRALETEPHPTPALKAAIHALKVYAVVPFA